MHSGLFSNSERKSVVFPLVADKPVTKVGLKSMLGMRQTVDQDQLPVSYLSTQNDPRSLQAVYKELKCFLAEKRVEINVPVTGVRTIHWFIPYSISPSDTGQEISPATLQKKREKRLADCIVCLQLLADPNLRVNDSVDSDNSYIISDFFTPDQFYKDSLQLLFSYGLSYETFCEGFKAHIEAKVYEAARKKYPSNNGYFSPEVENDLKWTIARRQKKLLYCLDSSSTDREKNEFAKKYNISREALDVIKNNDYMRCYSFLQRAYQSYSQCAYGEAATLYRSAEDLLKNFQGEPGLSVYIQSDYANRAVDCARYADICLRQLNQNKFVGKTQNKPYTSEIGLELRSSLSEWLCWRSSNETDKLSDDELEPLALDSSKIKLP